jgi:hypothetical protein
MPFNLYEAVPILINFRIAEIGAVPTAIHQKKTKVGAEIGAVQTAIYLKKFKVGIECGHHNK